MRHDGQLAGRSLRCFTCLPGCEYGLNLRASGTGAKGIPRCFGG